MRKFFSLFFSAIALMGVARTVSSDEAATIASAILKTSSITRVQATASSNQAYSATKAQNAPFYVFNAEDRRGFAIVAGDDRINSILGYSPHGSFDFENMPPALAALLDYYSAYNAAGCAEIETTSAPAIFNLNATQDEGVLLNTENWGQGAPYNSLCPLIGGDNAQAGCVATAMAIVMKYHNWPECGRGSHKYNTDPNGTNLDELCYGNMQFDYDAMSSGRDNEIAKLVRAAGHSVNMAYNVGLSSTYVWVVPNAMRRFFRYSPECQYIEKSHFSNEEWNHMLISQIDNGCPVIYSGFNKAKEGHAFVIDGYQGDMFHINWGWEGAFNGFFTLSIGDENLIPEYNTRQGMVINMHPDHSEKEYSPCWIDYGYLWRESDSDPLMILNPGTYVYPTEFEKGRQFDFYSKIINVPVDYACTFGLAVVDENENIRAVAPAFMTIDEGAYTLFCGINYTWNGVTLSTPTEIDIDLPDNYSLWVASKRDGTDKWELINGTMEAPSQCRFDGDNIPLSNIEYSFTNVDAHLGIPDNDEEDFVYSVNFADRNNAIIGSRFLALFKANNGVANIYLDNDWATNTDDVYRTSLEFRVLKDSYDIEVRYTGNEQLNEISLSNVTAGNIHNLLTDCDKIKSLSVQGRLNAEDIAFINKNCVSLQHLDLSEVEMCSWTSPDGVDYTAGCYPKNMFRPTKVLNDNANSTCNIWSVKSLSLPRNMTGWSGFLTDIELGGHNMVSLSIPANHDSERPEFYIHHCCGISDFSYQFVYAHMNDISEPLSKVAFPDIVKTHGHLFVPSGMKEKFESAEGWSDFKFITETEKPFAGKIIEKDGAQYVLLSNSAVLLSAPYECFHNSFSIADEITYNNESYPVKFIATQAITARDIRLVELPRDFDELDLNSFFGNRSITINKNLRNIVPQRDVYFVGGNLYLRNDALLDLSMMDSYVAYTEKTTPNFATTRSVGTVYVPGSTADRYKDSVKNSSNIIEMWTYEIDKSSFRVRITPILDFITINNIIINGFTIEGVNGIYDFSAIMNEASATSNNIDVSVNYTLNNEQVMSTRYDSNFNMELSSVDIELSGLDDIQDSHGDACDVYNIAGVLLIKKCERAMLRSLDPGVYIVRTGDAVQKILVK